MGVGRGRLGLRIGRGHAPVAGEATARQARVTRQVTSPIAGQLITHLVKVGDAVAVDTEVGIVEAMKMHIPVAAEQTGRVAKWLVSEKSVVAEGEPLLELEPER
jgi:acetyl-CoA carboxylase biotin carboxyl carrier protein